MADVAKTALNGAQATALVETVVQVATGQLPRASAVSIVELGFQLPHADAERILGDAGKGFTPTPPAG